MSFAIWGPWQRIGVWPLPSADALPGERGVLRWFHDLGSPIDQAMLAVSQSTDLLPLGAVATCVLLVLLVRNRWIDAALFTAGVAIVWAVNPLLKDIVGRSRPDLWPLPDPASEYSFPSGHAANTAALVGGLVLVLGRYRVLGAVLGAVVLVVVGVSQLVLGRHYPSDILAGWCWASAWIALLWAVRRRNMTKGGPG